MTIFPEQEEDPVDEAPRRTNKDPRRNPESIVFWANLAEMDRALAGSRMKTLSAKDAKYGFGPADRSGPRRTGGGRQAWAAGCGGDGGGGVRAAEVF